MTEHAKRLIRVSGNNQDEENQIPRINDHGARMGYTFVEPDVTMPGLSASKGEHEEKLMEAIHGMATGLYSVIVARHSDRIDRQERLREWMMLAAQAGGRFEFVDEPGLTLGEDLGSKIGVVVSAHNNKAYTDKLRHNVMDAHAARKARGSIVGKVGWGYSIWCEHCSWWSQGRPECRQHLKIPAPTELGRKHVKDIYSRALAGESLRSLAGWLSAETGQNISDTGIRNILTKPIYIGHHVYSDGSVCECEALVTADMQDQAAKALRSRLRRGQRGSKTLPALLIPGCLDCGGKAYRTATGGKTRGYAYYCRTCQRMISCEKLDSIVIGAVVAETVNEDETAKVWVEGSDSASARAEIKRAMRELDPDNDDYLDRVSWFRNALKALPQPVPGHFEERPTGRSKAEAVAEVIDDRDAMRDLLATWGVAFTLEGKWVRVKVNGAPEFKRLLQTAV